MLKLIQKLIEIFLKFLGLKSENNKDTKTSETTGGSENVGNAIEEEGNTGNPKNPELIKNDDNLNNSETDKNSGKNNKNTTGTNIKPGIEGGEANQIINLGNKKRRNKNYKRDTPQKNKQEKKLTKIEPPFIEINLDELKIYLVIPSQQITSGEQNIYNKKELFYKLLLNDDNQHQEISVSAEVKENSLSVKEKKIELKIPLRKFELIFPSELQSRVYNYEHLDDSYYIFVPIGNNFGRMEYIYNNEGRLNPIPRKELWVLVSEDFELIPEPYVVDERWVWNNYKLSLVNLQNSDQLTLRNEQSLKQIPCELYFSIKGDELVEDDFVEQSPLFSGGNIRIISTLSNSDTWSVEIESKNGNSKIISMDWSGREPLEIELSKDLPYEWGEFQINIYNNKDDELEETLFFRYIPGFKLEYPKNIIIPDQNNGHRKVLLYIRMGKDFIISNLSEEKENIYKEEIEDGYKIEIPPHEDTVTLSLCKKDNKEINTYLRITLPRLRWKISNSSNWDDKTLTVEREMLEAGKEIFFEIKKNQLLTNYRVKAILKRDIEKLQTKEFLSSRNVYSILLNQFYDTIKSNTDELKLTVEIGDDAGKEIFYNIDVIKFPEKVVQPIVKENYLEIKPYVLGGNKRLRLGKGFSKKEILEAKIDVKFLKKCGIKIDKRRKSRHYKNIEKLKTLVRNQKNAD